MSFDYALGGALAALLLVYLTVAAGAAGEILRRS